MWAEFMCNMHLMARGQIYLDIGNLATSRHLPYHERIENYRAWDQRCVFFVSTCLSKA